MLKLVSIIAVHGLGAHPYFTWVRKIRTKNQEVKEVMWLRDLLPSCVPNARIATFGYRSDWLTHKKGFETSLRALGEQLLNILERDRQNLTVSSDEESICVLLNWTYSFQALRRPIIFIGHSMGGLVIKQASITKKIACK